MSTGGKQRADRKWRRATKPQDLSLVIHFLSKAQHPKDSTTLKNRPQLLTYMGKHELIGGRAAFHIQTTTLRNSGMVVIYSFISCEDVSL